MRLRKIVVEKVTVVKYGVEAAMAGLLAVRIKVRMNASEFTDMRIALRK